jgi:uncharacterized protein (TIGR02145 family)
LVLGVLSACSRTDSGIETEPEEITSDNSAEVVMLAEDIKAVTIIESKGNSNGNDSTQQVCNKTTFGALLYYVQEDEFQVCTQVDDKYEFVTIDLSGAAGIGGADGSSCSAEEVAEGVRIFCDNGFEDILRDGTDGVDGLDGADGNSCSIADNGNGTYTLACEDGSTVILRDGIDGVNGTDGADGVNGVDGTDGIDGLNGIDGTSCTGAVVPTGIEITCGTVVGVLTNGLDGLNGADGSSCAVFDDGSGVYQLNCDDGSSVSWRDGFDGADGIDGANGVDGADGSSCLGTSVASGIEITCGGVLVGTLLHGRDGVDGSSCSALDNGDGTYTVSCTDGTSVTLRDGVDGVNGTDGVDGANGSDGVNGADGIDGINGADGVDGSSCSAVDNGDGSYTISCTDGTNVTLSDGQDGTDGVNGADGSDGVDGVDGSSCSVADNGDGTSTITCTDGTSAVIQGGSSGNPSTLTSINWLGSFTAQPINPAVNDAYYWIPFGVSCIWDGDAWGVLSADEDATAITCDVPEGYFVDARDGEVYSWVNIGGATWMAENLRYLPQVDHVSYASAETPYYYVYDYRPIGVTEEEEVGNAKVSARYQEYGVLYNWTAAVNGFEQSSELISSVQGACPDSWHLPSDSEFRAMMNYVDDAHDGVNNATEGLVLKSTTGWYGSGNGIDLFGFNALPAGFRNNTVEGFANLTKSTAWWTTTEGTDVLNAHSYELLYGTNYGVRHETGKYYGLSVRCVMD